MKAKVRFDTKQKVAENNLNINGIVIMKREKKGDKTKAEYYKTLLKIININHNMITVISEMGNQYTRNITHFKKVITTQQINDQTENTSPSQTDKHTPV